MRRNWSHGSTVSKAGKRSRQDFQPCQINPTPASPSRHHIRRAGTVRRRYQDLLRFLHRQARLCGRLHLWRAAVLRAGQARWRAAAISNASTQPVIDPELRDREQLLSAALIVETAEEIKALFLEFETAGVAFFQKLKREPWVREISSSGIPTAICCCSRDPRSSSYDRVAIAGDCPRHLAQAIRAQAIAAIRRHRQAERFVGAPARSRRGCRKIPCRNWRRRGGARAGFLTDLS